jgi:S1-C subfamily serine protease
VAEFNQALDDHNVGDKVTLHVWRVGEIREITVVLQAN